MHNMKIDQNQFEVELQRFNLEKNFLEENIRPIFNLIEKSDLTDNDKKKNQNELLTLGKFIYRFNKKIAITEHLRECPDFIVTLDTKNIGIELTELVLNTNDKIKRGTVEKGFKNVEQRLSGIDGIFRVEINDLEIHKKDLKEFENELENLMLGKKVNERFISDIQKTSPHKTLSFSYGKAWTTGQLEISNIITAIEKKNIKIEKYSNQTKENWLILTTTGIGSSGDFSHISDEIIKTEYNTKFDRLFFFPSFSSSPIELMKYA